MEGLHQLSLDSNSNLKFNTTLIAGTDLSTLVGVVAHKILCEKYCTAVYYDLKNGLIHATYERKYQQSRGELRGFWLGDIRKRWCSFN